MPAFVRNYGNGSASATNTITLGSLTLTSGDLGIMVVIANNGGGAITPPSTITDSLGNVWTLLVQASWNIAFQWQTFLYYSNLTVGGTASFTFTQTAGGNGLLRIGGSEYSGASVVDNGSLNNVTSTSGSVAVTIGTTLAAGNELVFAAFVCSQSGITAGSGWTTQGAFSVTNDFGEYQVAGSSGALTATTAGNGTHVQQFEGVIAAFSQPPSASHQIDCDAQLTQNKSHNIDCFAKATQASHKIDADAFNPNNNHSHFIDCAPGQGRSFVKLAASVITPIQPGAWVKLNASILAPGRNSVNLAATIVAKSNLGFVNLAATIRQSNRSFVKFAATIQKGGSPSHNIDCAAAVPTRSFVNLAATIQQKLSIGGCGNYPDISYVKLAAWIRDPKQSVQAPGSGLLPADDFNAAALAAGAYDQVSQIILAGIPLIVTGFTVGVISYQTRTRTWLKLLDEAPNGDYTTTKVETRKLATGQIITITTTTEQNQDTTIITVTTVNGDTPNLVQTTVTSTSKTGQSTVREILTNTTAGTVTSQETKTVFTKPPTSDNVQPLKVTTLDGIIHYQFFGAQNQEWAGGDVEGKTLTTTQVSIQPGVLNGQSTDQFGNPILQRTTLVTQVDPTGKETDTTTVEIGTRSDYGTTVTDTESDFNGIQTKTHKVVNYPNGSQQITDTTTNALTGDSFETTTEIVTDIYGNVTTTTTAIETKTVADPTAPGGFRTTTTKTVTTLLDGATTSEVTTTTDNNFEDSIVNDKIRVYLIQEFTINVVIDWQNMDALLEYNIQHQTQYALVELFGQQLGNAQLSYAFRQRLIQQFNQAANCMIPLTLQALGKTYQVVFAPSASAFRAKYIPGTEPNVYELQLILQERSNLINGTRQFG
jgi:hypothetical protein